MHMCFNKKEKIFHKSEINMQFYALNNSMFTIKSEENTLWVMN